MSLETDARLKPHLKYRYIHVYLNLRYFYDALFTDYHFVLRTYLHVPVVYTKYMYNVEKSTYSPEINLYKMFQPLDNQFFNNMYT